MSDKVLRKMLSLLMLLCGVGIAIPGSTEETEKESSTMQAVVTSDAFCAEMQKRSPDLVIEKVLVPPKGVPSYVVYMKAKEKDVKPAVIVMHGGKAGAESKLQPFGWGWPQDLARMGYLVLSPDAWGCGEHPGVAEAKAMPALPLWTTLIPRVKRSAEDNGDIRRYLQSRPDVDGDRIALMGASGGAITALATEVLMDGFAAVVAMNPPGDFLNEGWKGSMLFNAEKMETPQDEPTRAAIMEVDPLYHLDQFAPVPLLIVHGKHDLMALPQFTVPLYEQLLPHYKGQEERLQRVEFDAYPLPTHRPPEIFEMLMTHASTRGMHQACYDWLEKYVGHAPKVVE